MPSPLNLRSRIAGALVERVDATPAAPASTPAPVAERADATPNAIGSTTSGAAMSNALSGMGLPSDAGATTRPNVQRAYLSDTELVALLRGTVYRRVVEIYPREATRAGWSVQDDTDDPDPLHDIQRRLDVRSAFQRADAWARTFGESRVWMVTDDPAELNEPLDPSTVRGIHALQVFDKMELSPATYTTDIQSPNYGRPETYWITPRRVGVATAGGKPVHYTRLLRFFGEPLPPSQSGLAGQTWGDADAVGQVLWDAIRHLGDVSGGGAKLAQELTMAVFHFANAAGASAGSDRSAWLTKLSTLNQMKSAWQAVFLGLQDKFERMGANASGFRDLSEHAKAELAMLTEIPVEVLFGQAPSGLSSDGSSWQANWYARVSAYQEEHLRPALERLIPVLYYADRGSLPESWAVEFHPLAKLSPLELADLRLRHTQADQIAMLDGVLTPERVARSRYSDGTFALEIQPLTPDEQAEQDRERTGESDPDLIASAEAALERMAGGEESPGVPAASGAVPEKAADIALNGAQITSALAIVQEVAAGGLPRESGVQMLQAFFNMSQPMADEIMGPVGQGFVAPREDALDDEFRAQRFKIPAGARGNARKVRRWRDEHGDEVAGMTATGWRRARQLAEDETVSGQDLIEIAAWGARHAANADLSDEHRAEPWRDAGYVAWLGWGGDSMINHAAQVVDRNRDDRTDAAGSGVVLWLPLPDAERPEFDAMVAEAAATGIDLTPTEAPHVTVLYLGAVPEQQMAEVVGIARDVVAGFAPMRLRAVGVDLFGSPDSPAVVQRVRAWDVRELHNALLRALAHIVVAPQRARFRPHLTLGSAPPLTDEQAAAVLSLQPPEDFGDEGPVWISSSVQVVRDGVVSATLPMLGTDD